MARWVRVESRNRCSHCGRMVEAGWKWFPRPGTWTLCYCDSCVEQLLEEPDEGSPTVNYKEESA